jgi:putative tryptophan/tyrosine transport system substrate-binding protein
MKLKTIGLIGILTFGLLGKPLPAEAQSQAKVPVIGYLNYKTGPNRADEAFLQALRDLGWIEGQNIAIEYRWTGGKRDRRPVIAEELVQRNVDIIVTATQRMTRVAKNATRTLSSS